MTRFAWMCATEAYEPEVLIRQAQRAEAAGFDAIVVPDAFYPWTAEGTSSFTWSWLGAAAQATERVQLITTVTAPFLRYHPAVIAQAAATLDRISGGRFVLGLGTGHPLHDASLGFGSVPNLERRRHLADTVRIIRALLTGERVSFEGERYRLDDVQLFSPPTHGVPIWLAASGPKAANIAGTLGDGVITSVKDVDQALDRVIDPFREAAAEAGNPSPSVLTTLWAIIGETDEEAWRALGPMRGLRLPSRDVLTDPREFSAQADAAGPAAILPGFARATNAADTYRLYEPIVTRIQPDVVSIQLHTTDPDGTIDTVGAEVLPRLRKLTD